MLSVGHAACTEYAELSHRSRKQSVANRPSDHPGRPSQAGTLLLSLLLPLLTGAHCCDGVQCPPPHLHWSQSHTSVASRLLDTPQIPTSLVSHAPAVASCLLSSLP